MEISLSNDSPLGLEIARLVRELAAERLAIPDSETATPEQISAGQERFNAALTRVVPDLLKGTSAEANPEVAERVAYFAATAMKLFGDFAGVLDKEIIDSERDNLPKPSAVALQGFSRMIEEGEIGFT